MSLISTPSSLSGPDGFVSKLTRTRAVASLLAATPLLFGVPVALGIARTTVGLFGMRYPALGWATTVNSDAEQLYLGHTLYQDPAHGYTGLLYTPLYPALTSVVDHLYLWNGWPLILTIGATVALMVLVARVAYPPTGPTGRLTRLLGAAGVGGIAYWCVSSIELSLLDEARADQLAWAFALFGLVAVADFGSTPSRRRVVVAALLLTAGFWTKQTTVSVATLPAAWVLALAATSLLSRRAAWLFIAVLGGVNIALLAMLNILTHGWEFFISFELATHEATKAEYASYIDVGLQSCAWAACFAATMWLACAARGAMERRRSSRGRVAGSRGRVAGSRGRGVGSRGHAAGSRLRRALAAEDPTGRRVALFGLFTPLGFALAVYYLRGQGTASNQYIGIVWTLGLLAAAGWRVAQRHLGVAAIAAGGVALYFVLVQLGPIRETVANRNVPVPDLENVFAWTPLDPELMVWASRHSYYGPVYADLNVPQGGPLYPNAINFIDKLATGIQPMFLVRALLDRRFESVGYLPTNADLYASGYGKWEENYMWKLNAMIHARYVASEEAPPGVLVRRPGPEQDAWMRDCFGPFAIGGVGFRIRRGGGFWCSFAPGELHLMAAPTPLSEVVAMEPVSLAGTVKVILTGQAPTHAELRLEAGGETWIARVATPRGNAHDLEISSSLDGVPLGKALVSTASRRGGGREAQLSVTPTRGRPAPLVPNGPRAATLTAPAAMGQLSLIATNGAVIDFRDARLGHQR